MQISSLTRQVSTQAAAQASALASLLLLRKTLLLQGSNSRENSRTVQICKAFALSKASRFDLVAIGNNFLF